MGSLLSRNFHTQVIYVTGHAEYISSSYETRNVGFLLKPVQADDLRQALRRAFLAIEAPAERSFTVKAGSFNLVVVPSRVIYVTSGLRQCTFHFVDLDDIHTYMKLGDAQALLPHWFIRCHNSYIVNPAYVEATTVGGYVVRGGVKIPVSKRRRAESDERLFRFMNGDFDV